MLSAELLIQKICVKKKDKNMSKFEIIYENLNKKTLQLNEHDFKKWLCEKVFQ